MTDERHLTLAPTEDFVPATLEQNRAGLRTLFLELYGWDLEQPHATGPGTCDDCHHGAPLVFTYSSKTLCAQCCRYRIRAQLQTHEAA